MKKQSLVMLIVLAVLSATLFLGYYFQKSRREGRKAAQTVSTNVKIDVKDTGDIQTNNVLLRYSDGTWVYDDSEKEKTFPVSTDTVTDFLERVQNFKRGRLVEKKPSDLGKYGLDSSEGTSEGKENPLELTIKSKNGEERLHLLVSKKASPAAYAQFGNEESIYKVDSSLHRELEADSSYWLDKRLFQGGLDVENIKAVKLSRESGGGFSLKRKRAKDNWMLEGASDADKIKEDEVERYLKSIQSASGSAFTDLEMNPDSKIADLTLTLSADDSERGVNLYRIEKKEDGGTGTAAYYVQEVGRKYVLELPEYLNQNLFGREAGSFLKEDPEIEAEADSEDDADSETDSKE